MRNSDLNNLWLVLVNIKAKPGYEFKDLIETEPEDKGHKYKGACANLIIKADTVNEAIDIVPLGLAELNFEVVFIDKVENIASLIENNEINKNVIAEAKWLKKSEFVFKISDKIFSYI